MSQLEMFPETDEDKERRLTDIVSTHSFTCSVVRKNRSLMDEHLKASVLDIEKVIKRLERKMAGLRAYLDTRQRLAKTEALIEKLMFKE